MKIQILDTGCPKCKQLMQHTEEAVKAIGIDAEIEKVTQINDIMKFGVMLTPALAIDGEVKPVGKVLSPEAIQGMLHKKRGHPYSCSIADEPQRRENLPQPAPF